MKFIGKNDFTFFIASPLQGSPLDKLLSFPHWAGQAAAEGLCGEHLFLNLVFFGQSALHPTILFTPKIIVNLWPQKKEPMPTKQELVDEMVKLAKKLDKKNLQILEYRLRLKKLLKESVKPATNPPKRVRMPSMEQINMWKHEARVWWAEKEVRSDPALASNEAYNKLVLMEKNMTGKILTKKELIIKIERCAKRLDKKMLGEVLGKLKI